MDIAGMRRKVARLLVSGRGLKPYEFLRVRARYQGRPLTRERARIETPDKRQGPGLTRSPAYS